jgi:hypothetical protein
LTSTAITHQDFGAGQLGERAEQPKHRLHRVAEALEWRFGVFAQIAGCAIGDDDGRFRGRLQAGSKSTAFVD